MLKTKLRTTRKPRKAIPERRTRVFSGRVIESKLRELKRLYPTEMTESEIVNDLVRERLAREKFDRWMNELKGNFKIEDLDLESYK